MSSSRSNSPSVTLDVPSSNHTASIGPPGNGAYSPDTVAIHGGLEPDPSTGAILTPIHQVTTFAQDAIGEHRGFTYSRSGNPTVAAYERHLGAREGVGPAVATSTGMSALTLLFLATLTSGDEVLVSDVVYGGTVRLLRDVLGPLGVRHRFVDTANLEAVDAAFTPATRLVLIESPANPTLKLTDIAAVATLAHRHGAHLAVDNTFLTATLQPCFPLGADLVVLSTTKYTEGHNTTVGGAVLARNDETAERLRFLQNALGIAQSPFESWLTLRGLKTLGLRMERHSVNALAVAKALRDIPRVTSVTYPWLDDFPQLALAQRQQRAGGGMLTFEVDDGEDLSAAIAVMNALQLCTRAENLGSVETLVTHPASMTHADVPREQRVAAGLGDGLIRLSVGLEDPADVIADLTRALRA